MSLDKVKALEIIRMALKEDIPSGDITCDAVLPK